MVCRSLAGAAAGDHGRRWKATRPQRGAGARNHVMDCAPFTSGYGAPFRQNGSSCSKAATRPRDVGSYVTEGA
ncbi:hypothetical protein KCP74_16265 [Salmonella enterica subsp. enterica]|nr:hypothetical protein KCP74_16265 [Salmonella enterica subsp. enterica]